VDRDTQARPRYRMLETVRQYAEERLNEAGESDDVRTRHLLHYVALAEQAAPQLHGAEQGPWFATLRHEQENLLAAHAWCAHAPQGGELGLRLAGSLGRYWFFTAQWARGYRLAETALALAGPEPDSVERCQTLYAMQAFALPLGHYEEQHACAERGLAMARRIGAIELE